MLHTEPTDTIKPADTTDLALLPSQPSLLTATGTTTIPAVGSYPPVAQPAVTHAPPLITCTTSKIIAQLPSYQIETRPSYQIVSNAVLPVPAQIQKKIT